MKLLCKMIIYFLTKNLVIRSIAIYSIIIRIQIEWNFMIWCQNLFGGLFFLSIKCFMLKGNENIAILTIQHFFINILEKVTILLDSCCSDLVKVNQN